MPETATPCSDTTLLEEARDRFLGANNLSVQEYLAPIFTIGVFVCRSNFPTQRDASAPCRSTIYITCSQALEPVGWERPKSALGSFGQAAIRSSLTTCTEQECLSAFSFHH